MLHHIGQEGTTVSFAISVSYLLGAHGTSRVDAETERALIPPAAAVIARKTLDCAVVEYRQYALSVLKHNQVHHPRHAWPIKGLREFLDGWRSYWWLADWYAFSTVPSKYKVQLIIQTNKVLADLITERFPIWSNTRLETVTRSAETNIFSSRSWKLLK